MLAALKERRESLERDILNGVPVDKYLLLVARKNEVAEIEKKARVIFTGAEKEDDER